MLSEIKRAVHYGTWRFLAYHLTYPHSLLPRLSPCLLSPIVDSNSASAGGGIVSSSATSQSSVNPDEVVALRGEISVLNARMAAMDNNVAHLSSLLAGLMVAGTGVGGHQERKRKPAGDTTSEDDSSISVEYYRYAHTFPSIITSLEDRC